MQSVIGSYDHFDDARHAVRRLEHHQFSIQDVVIAEQPPGTKRKNSGRRDPGLRFDAPFLVLMTSEPAILERARLVLSSASRDQPA